MKKQKQRYFIVFYKGNYGQHQFDGNLGIKTNGRFLNKKKTTKTIIEEKGYDDAVAVGISEVTEEDYEEWFGKP